MKYAIFGDIHGKELGDLEKALKSEKVDTLVCTGDFDQVKTIRQFMDLEEKYRKEGKQVITVPGNHDHAILDNLVMDSATLRRQGKNSYQLSVELKQDPIAHKYIQQLVNSTIPLQKNTQKNLFIDENQFGKEYLTTVVHGGYEGNTANFPGCPPEVKEMYNRLKTEEDYIKNFEVMKKRGEKIMIRGHDHFPDYSFVSANNRLVSHSPFGINTEFRLFNDEQHIINPGPLFSGYFATIDTKVPDEESPILRYHKL